MANGIINALPYGLLPPFHLRKTMVGVGCSISLLAAISVQSATAEPAPPSRSKLSIHQLTDYLPGAHEIIQAHPRVLKILNTNGPAMQAARDYKASTPDGLVVFRQYTQERFYFSEDPAQSGRYFWHLVLRPPLEALSAEDRALIDYVEGPNECDSTPCWGSTENAAWFNEFWMALAPLISDAGFKPCAFSIPVGNPPGPEAELRAQLDAITPALRLVKDLDGAWSYHSYTLWYTTDPIFEYYHSLRHRRFYDYFAEAHPDLLDLPIILTEGGVDAQDGPDGPGWRGGGDAEKYKNWLAWHDEQIRQDDYVLGVTLFQSGSSGWYSFEVEPIAGWLADHLVAAGPMPRIALSPAKITPAVPEGQALPPESFTIANSGGVSLDYAISTSADWLSVTPTDGQTTGPANTHTIAYDVAQLSEGVYETQVVVTSDNACNSPQTLEVRLWIKSPWFHGDFDHDRDVDQSDFGRFQACLSGPGVEQPAPDCRAADLDGDADVDADDYDRFQACLSGANLPAGPDCLD